MDQAVIETKQDTIFCPGCGEELEVPKPKVAEVIYHPRQMTYSYLTYAPYVEVYFQEKVKVGHKCPDPTRDKVTPIESAQPRGRFQLWN